jgi:uncharacterized protein YggU (UPF0235/DUF167 family)
MPRASAERIGPYAGATLELRVTRPAVDGQATEAARRLLADGLGVAPSTVRLVSGARSRLKRFDVFGMDADALASALERYRPLD